jgi:hypothetical protein
MNAAVSMHSTIMHFATCFPDWNSLDSVRRAHSFLEGTALVFFALLVVCEALAHLSDDKQTERRFDKVGIVFFALAVLAEIVAYPYGQRNDTLSAQVIGSLDAKSKEAYSNASSALTKSGEAETKAATESASAMNIARGARLEADTFEADIKSAKKQAAEAESHLADALQRAADAEAELFRLKTPRSLVGSDKLIAALKPFSGTEYTLNVFMDDESIQFTKVVAGALDEAGWVRKPAVIALGIPTMEIVFKQGTSERVPACVDTGISLRAHAKESLAVLQATPVASLPKTVGAAFALKSEIAASISPSDERNVVNGIIDPKQEEGIPVMICVGKKP